MRVSASVKSAELSTIAAEPAQVVEPQGGQLPAPYTAPVQCLYHGVSDLAGQRCPVSKQDALFAHDTSRVLKPGKESGRRRIGFAFCGQLQFAGLVDEAHAGEVVGNYSPPRWALECVIPARWFIAVHVVEKLLPVTATQYLGNFGGPFPSLCQAP